MQNNQMKRDKQVTLVHLTGSNKNHGMRVSPNDLSTNDACQFITKVNDRAFIYRLNFGTYDGCRNMESESA